MKTFVKLLIMLGMIAYLVFAFVEFNKSRTDVECTKVLITIDDADKANFVTVEDIRQILKDTHLNPIGKRMSEVRLSKIKKAVEGHQFVQSSLCYTTPKGELVIEARQKLPVLRVMPDNGEGYYIDVVGNKIPHVNYPADVIVVTGTIDYNKMKPVLATFGQIVLEDEFWNDMIEQINVTADGKIELTPRLGNHIVALGNPNALGLKLSRLKTFYKNVLNDVGWEKYSRISLEYENEVVCTKKEMKTYNTK